MDHVEPRLAPENAGEIEGDDIAAHRDHVPAIARAWHELAGQQDELKKEEAGIPDGGDPAQHRQHHR